MNGCCHPDGKHGECSVRTLALPLPCWVNLGSLTCFVFPPGLEGENRHQNQFLLPSGVALEGDCSYSGNQLLTPVSTPHAHTHHSGVPLEANTKTGGGHAMLLFWQREQLADTGHRLVTSSGTREGPSPPSLSVGAGTTKRGRDRSTACQLPALGRSLGQCDRAGKETSMGHS